MSEHRAKITWRRTSADFLKGKYSREHTWTFDGGITVPASASPSVVPTPYSNPANIDPEEAFVAAISSCHMLTFLHLASRAGFTVESYDDDAVGKMGKNENGLYWVEEVVLNTKIVYGGSKLPTPAEETELHERAHEECFIANSVKTRITVRPDSAPSAQKT
jgi:organic hydroperoxide reductase OsmC/OhrA